MVKQLDKRSVLRFASVTVDEVPARPRPPRQALLEKTSTLPAMLSLWFEGAGILRGVNVWKTTYIGGTTKIQFIPKHAQGLTYTDFNVLLLR